MAKNDLAMIKAENERLVTEVERLKQRLREEITRTQSGVRLDLNLEKGRMREESSKQELKIKEVDTRIEQEIANLKTNIQASKATTLQYLVGFGMYFLPSPFISCIMVLPSLTTGFSSHRLFCPPYGISQIPRIIDPLPPLCIFIIIYPALWTSSTSLVYSTLLISPPEFNGRIITLPVLYSEKISKQTSHFKRYKRYISFRGIVISIDKPTKQKGQESASSTRDIVYKAR